MGLTNPSPPAAAAARIQRSTSAAAGSGSIILEKYQLGRLLGRGSFAKVYLGRSLLDKTDDVAVKVIDKASTVDAAMEPLILREVSAMRRLHHHPNILKLHEVMATKSKIYLVMELAPGGELFAKLSRCRRFSEASARRYFQQVVSALRFCHQNGVFHRDIKPQNLLLDHNGLLKITDFGLSALSEQKRDDGLIYTACGTPAYTAPEVVYRKGYDGEKADAWSCGVLLYVFLVGSLPFDDSNLSNMYRAMHRRAFDFPDWVSKPAKVVIYRLLDPNPSTRLSLDDLTKLSWFKKSFSQENLSSLAEEKLGPESLDPKNSPRVNAFDLISMSSGLNLSGLFEKEISSREMRFFTWGMQDAGEIEEKVSKAGGGLGYKIELGRSGGIRMVKGRVVLVVWISEVAAQLWLVELKLADSGGMEFGEIQWEELKAGLGDIVLSWQKEVS